MCCKSQHAGRPAHKHACKTPGLLDRSSPNFKRSSGVFDSVDACIHVAILPSIVKRQRFEWRRAIQKCSVLINLHPVSRMTDNNTFLYTAINIPVFMPLTNYNAWWKCEKLTQSLCSRAPTRNRIHDLCFQFWHLTITTDLPVTYGKICFCSFCHLKKQIKQ